ncbi:carboxypeptidase-like regulatory domain-containing protein, partial [Muriicola sp.]|uniref:carboxypeptidase-like regulatory domain-containing protein n=1 Tax=Muriicola sp. TaxID=2020856 RepID=UPI003566F050
MEITRLKSFLFCLATLFLVHTSGLGQDDNRVDLITYLLRLEREFNVKFSYVDEDLKDIEVSPPAESDLHLILDAIQEGTQLRIDKLSERYYSIVQRTTIDICGYVYDNYGSNTIPGASVEVLGGSVAIVTDMDGKFSLTNIPREATLRIRFLGFKPRFVTASDLAGNDCPSLLMAVSYQELQEVVVYQFLTTGLTRETDGSILLRTDDFGILPGLSEPDILQTVQALPGIKSIDETVSDINIR